MSPFYPVDSPDDFTLCFLAKGQDLSPPIRRQQYTIASQRKWPAVRFTRVILVAVGVRGRIAQPAATVDLMAEREVPVCKYYVLCRATAYSQHRVVGRPGESSDPIGQWPLGRGVLPIAEAPSRR